MIGMMIVMLRRRIEMITLDMEIDDHDIDIKIDDHDNNTSSFKINIINTYVNNSYILVILSLTMNKELNVMVIIL